MDKLKTYLMALPVAEREALAAKCGTSWASLRNVLYGFRPAGEKLCVRIEQETGGAITRGEMLKIAKACRCRHSRAVIRIAFYSGMGMSEILSAGIEGDAFVLADTKNGKPRHVPIHPKIASSPRLRTKDRFWVSKRFKEAARAVGMGRLRFHDLRHSAAGTKRYAHLATGSLRAALEMVGRKFPDAQRKGAA